MSSHAASSEPSRTRSRRVRKSGPGSVLTAQGCSVASKKPSGIVDMALIVVEIISKFQARFWKQAAIGPFGNLSAHDGPDPSVEGNVADWAGRCGRRRQVAVPAHYEELATRPPTATHR